MIKLFLSLSILALALSLIATTSKSAELSDQLLPAKNREAAMLDRWNEVRHRAAIAVSIIPHSTPARHVKRYAKPEIIIKGSVIFFDGIPLEFGRPLASWKNTLKRTPHCDKTGIEWCVWENLGLEVYAGKEDNFRVSTVSIKLSIRKDLYEGTVTSYPDGTPYNPPKADWLARHPFTGYLESMDLALIKIQNSGNFNRTSTLVET